MENSVQAMKNRNGLWQPARRCNDALNEAAMMMKNSMESMMQGGGTGRNDVDDAAASRDVRSANEF